MSSGQTNANALRGQKPVDTWSGGRRLLQLLREMVDRDMERCEIRVLKERVDCRLSDGDGLQAPGPDWAVSDVLQAILYIRREILDLEDWKRNAAPNEDAFTLGPMSGLLPPGLSALRCKYSLRPDLSLGLHVLTEDEAQAHARSPEKGDMD